MSRISCNVTKDLLPSYLDGVCSGESGELVEEHLAECPACRKFLEGLQRPDPGQDGVRVDYLQKVRRAMDIQSLIGIFLPLAMLLAGFYGMNTSVISRSPTAFYYIEMPVMMVLCAYLLGSGRSSSMPSGKEWIAPVSGAALVLLAAVLWYVLCYRMPIWLEEEAVLPIPPDKMGPLLHKICLTVGLASAALLAALVIRAKKRGRVFPVSSNLAWLALNMALSLDVVLYRMSDPEPLRRFMTENSAILLTEFTVVTVLLLLFRRKEPKERLEI